MWAPNAVAFFVPKRELVTIARKKLLKDYGKPLKGEDPVWPDGSSMRFLPVKGAAIRNDRTNEIIRKRMAYHIWMKANETTINTNVVNIHESIEAFGNKTFSEIVLEMADPDTGTRMFNHFNRAWSNDPRKEKWGLSVKPNMVHKAEQAIQHMKDTLFDAYGPEIDKFFEDYQMGLSYWDAAQGRPRNINQEDDDDWFEEEDDIDDLIKRGIVDTSFIQFLSGQQNTSDKESVVSWGTGDSTYTELVENQTLSTSGTLSSITQDPINIGTEDIAQRKGMVKELLMKQGVTNEEINSIMMSRSPYELAFSGIQLPTWEPTKEVFLIMAIRSSVDNTNTESTNDE